MIIEFEIGDRSGDGHGQHDTYYYECRNEPHDAFHCTLTGENVQAAYEMGTAKLGFDLVKDCCDYYEEMKLSEEHMDILVSLGFVHEDLEEMKEECIQSEQWIHIYMFICNLGNPDIVFIEKRFQNINLGGYGLYQ